MIITKRLKNKNNLISENSLDSFKSKDVIWADIIAPSQKEIKKVSLLTGISLDYFEEYLQKDAKPRIVEIRDYTFIVLNVPSIFENAIKTRPLVVILSKKLNDFITIHAERINAIDRLRLIGEQSLASIFAKGPVVIFYYLMEEILDSYFSIMDEIEEKIDSLEETIFNNKDKNIMQDVHETKKTLIYIHKSLIGNREILSAIENEYISFFTKEDLKKFRMLYTDVNQLVDLSLAYRDILSSSVEVHLANISNNLNIVMKKLTAWAAIILVPALIAGIYGMNFKYIPELEWKYGYFFALGLMVLSFVGLYYFSKKNNWI